MSISSREGRVIKQIISAHGPTLDLKDRPEVLIEIIRKWSIDLADEIPDAGVRPGGVGPVGPTSRTGGPMLEDLMKEVIKVQRQLDKLSARLDT